MKIAIIGNMNNNGFSLMRYFNYLGIETHLFLFSNDGKGPFEHFSVENDTWEYDKWSHNIHRLIISNGYRGVIGFPERLKFPFYKKYITKTFSNFDYLIGCGIAPSLFSSTDLNLDIFYPYSMGIEYVGNIPTINRLNNASLPIKLLCSYLRANQIKGIKKAKYCLNADMGLTKDTFNEINCDFISYAIPMLYNLESISNVPISESLNKVLNKIKESELSIISHCRHLWVNDKKIPASEWYQNTKNNDWLIKGFSKLVREVNSKSLLILLEYGEDVEYTKELIKKLKLENNVLWLPRMPRKEIMFLIKSVDIGVGEFYNTEKTLWGGTGWEILSSGKPLLQSFRFQEGEFEELMGYEEPKLLNVLNEEDVFTHLSNFFTQREIYIEIGKSSEMWFNKYNGQSLAKKWLSLLVNSK